jgi:environmental stress-induced protein Ves
MASYDRHWRFADLEPTPWRNGGGSTWEIAAEPAGASMDDFDWRVSIAAVEAAGPFSIFAGVDRMLALIDGPSMLLTIDGEEHGLQALSTVAFAGESRTTCQIPGGPTRDLNVMTRRGRVSATLELIEVAGSAELAAAQWLLLVDVRGRVEVGSFSLDPMDGVLTSRPDPTAVDGSGILAVVRLTG